MPSRLPPLLFSVFFCAQVHAGDWITDQKGCKAWNASPSKGETTTWSGQCKDGYATGNGVWQWFVNGKPTSRYEGDMLNGYLHGKGTYKWINGTIYSGKWENHKQIYGKVTFPDGDVYEGGFQADGFTPAGKTQRQLAEENYKQAKYERLRRCPHIYNGRSVEFDARRALFTDYYAGKGVVTGFSPERGVASIRKPNGESVEIGCERIAE